MSYFTRTIYRKMSNGSDQLVVAVKAQDAEAAFERIRRVYGETHNPFGNWRIGWNWKEEGHGRITKITHGEFEDMRQNPYVSIIR